MAKNSQQVKQAAQFQTMANNYSAHQLQPIQKKAHQSPVQRKTIIENCGQPCKYGPLENVKTVAVGHRMNAWLDPEDNIRGQSANVNASQDGLMAHIKNIYPLAAGPMSVKGHLLNDNLGGTALDNNLYPISKGANGKHLSTAENYVKTAVWKNKKAVKYSVEVEVQGPNDYTVAASDGNKEATFRTTVSDWNDVNDPGKVSGPVYTANVVSNLGTPKVRNAHDAMGVQQGNISGYGLKPAVDPADKVGDLSDAEQSYRKSQPAGLRISGNGGGKVNYEQMEVDTADGTQEDKAIFSKIPEMSPLEFAESYIDDNCRSLIVEALDSPPDVSDALAYVMEHELLAQFIKALPAELAELAETNADFGANCGSALYEFFQEEYESRFG